MWGTQGPLIWHPVLCVAWGDQVVPGGARQKRPQAGPHTPVPTPPPVRQGHGDVGGVTRGDKAPTPLRPAARRGPSVQGARHFADRGGGSGEGGGIFFGGVCLLASTPCPGLAARAGLQVAFKGVFGGGEGSGAGLDLERAVQLGREGRGEERGRRSERREGSGGKSRPGPPSSPGPGPAPPGSPAPGRPGGAEGSGRPTGPPCAPASLGSRLRGAKPFGSPPPSLPSLLPPSFLPSFSRLGPGREGGSACSLLSRLPAWATPGSRLPPPGPSGSPPAAPRAPRAR